MGAPPTSGCKRMRRATAPATAIRSHVRALFAAKLAHRRRFRRALNLLSKTLRLFASALNAFSGYSVSSRCRRSLTGATRRRSCMFSISTITEKAIAK